MVVGFLVVAAKVTPRGADRQMRGFELTTSDWLATPAIKVALRIMTQSGLGFDRCCVVRAAMGIPDSAF